MCRPTVAAWAISSEGVPDPGQARRRGHRRALAGGEVLRRAVNLTDDESAPTGAWRAIGGFEERSSLRAWLYKIATNICLSAIERRGRRVHPVDHGPRTDPAGGPGEPPPAESTWIEPFPDAALGLEEGFASPEATYEQREAVVLV